jgi:hypothetical protein
MLRAERVAIEEHTERRTLASSMRQATRLTRASSPRQLPTDHDYAVPTREYQSDQPSQKLLDWPLALSSEKHNDQDERFVLLATVFQNGPRRKGFASPRPHRAPLTAPGRSKLRSPRRKNQKWDWP